MQATAVRASGGNIGPIDIDGEYGTVTLPAVVGGKRGQVIAEGATRKPMVSKIHDAADVERRTALKRFFREANAEGLDTSDARRMREALSVFLGRWVESRRQLSAGEWSEASAALFCGQLAW